MSDWDDLLLSGGFAPRELLLSGLSVEQVSAQPYGIAHSIYQEVWHVTMVLTISLDRGRAALERWPYPQHFPLTAAPKDQLEWQALVAQFLRDSRRAVALAHDLDWLNAAEPEYPNSTWRDGLAFLAVHTAYHMGKVVCLRQIMGIWPPESITH